MAETKKYWFKRRRFGYGWIPTTWQGWLTIIVFAFPVIGDAFTLPKNPTHHQMAQFFLVLFVDLALLIFIIIVTGPKPHWRWGKKDTDNPSEDF